MLQAHYRFILPYRCRTRSLGTDSASKGIADPATLGSNRPFMPGIAHQTSQEPPLIYFPFEGTDFYNMVNELYTISLSLTHQDTITVRFWADVPGNLNVPAHATNILTQLIELNKFDLDKAAYAYAKNGIAMNGARSFDSFDAYANDAGHSRLLGGIHYGPSIAKGLIHGNLVSKAASSFSLASLH